jgi:hypothetical protein
MSVVLWLTEDTWQSCVDAGRWLAPPGADVVLLHVTSDDVAAAAHGAYRARWDADTSNATPVPGSKRSRRPRRPDCSTPPRPGWVVRQRGSNGTGAWSVKSCAPRWGPSCSSSSATAISRGWARVASGRPRASSSTTRPARCCSFGPSRHRTLPRYHLHPDPYHSAPVSSRKRARPARHPRPDRTRRSRHAARAR